MNPKQTQNISELLWHYLKVPNLGNLAVPLTLSNQFSSVHPGTPGGTRCCGAKGSCGDGDRLAAVGQVLEAAKAAARVPLGRGSALSILPPQKTFSSKCFLLQFPLVIDSVFYALLTCGFHFHVFAFFGFIFLFVCWVLSRVKPSSGWWFMSFWEASGENSLEALYLPFRLELKLSTIETQCP